MNKEFAITVTATETVSLTGWHYEVTDSVRALLYGQLVKLALPVVEHYHSDLFHDANWVAKHVTEAIDFYYVPRTWGTYLGTEFYPVSLESGGVPYRLRLWTDKGHWNVTIETLLVETKGS